MVELGWSFRGAFFFFQAEDGIRDTSVTGVQTCALPISPQHLPGPPGGPDLRRPAASVQPPGVVCSWGNSFLYEAVTTNFNARDPATWIAVVTTIRRSEERRVGKECRSGCWRAQYNTSKR